jgi:hypothetical protein
MEDPLQQLHAATAALVCSHAEAPIDVAPDSQRFQE